MTAYLRFAKLRRRSQYVKKNCVDQYREHKEVNIDTGVNTSHTIKKKRTLNVSSHVIIVYTQSSCQE